MTDLSKKSKIYYLLFNFPIQLLALYFLFQEVSWLWILSFYILIYWAGVQAGAHKLFAHRSWTPKFNWIKYLLAWISCFGMMGGPIVWAGVHRQHHAHSDTDKDPHSPRHGIIHSYFGWLMNPSGFSPTSVKDHLRDPVLIKIDKYCRELVIVPLVILAVIDIKVMGSLTVAMFIVFHFEMSVNAFLHKNTNNGWQATNNTILAGISGGSTLHGNHHESPSNYTFSKSVWQLDPSAWIINILKK